MYGKVENVIIHPEERILVDDWNYFLNAMKLYKEYTENPEQKKMLKNLLVWVLLKERTGVLPKRYKDAKQDFDKVFFSKFK